MKKRIRASFASSLVLPILAIAVLMLRLFDPHTRWVALGLYLVGWVLFVFALRRHPRTRAKLSSGKLKLKDRWADIKAPVLTALALSVVGGFALVILPPGHAEIAHLPAAELERRIEFDLLNVEQTSLGLIRSRAEFERAFRQAEVTDAQSKQELAQAWASYFDHAVGLDQLHDSYKFFYRINPLKHTGLNSRAFLIAYVSLSSQAAQGLELQRTFDNDRNLETWLDEAHPELGLPDKSFLRFRAGIARADNWMRLAAGFSYLEIIDRAGRLQGDREQRLVALARKHYRSALTAVGKDPDVALDAPLDYFEAAVFKAWFPLQKGVAVGISDIRTTGRDNFVSAEDIQQAHAKLEPGDVLLERRNWYATNIGLPGFWPHAAFYTGSLDELDSYFDEDSRQATDGLAPSKYLKQQRPKVYAGFAAGDHGNPIRVIEAIGEGVVLTSLEHSAHADYLAALRPKQTKTEKLDSLMRAFTHFGKPYDYNFDFVTDDAIVCSELVYKSLQPTAENTGIQFDLVSQSGRLVLPPNNIIRKFDEQFDSPEADLSFVLFFDGREELQRALPRDARELRASWKRPKWDLMQP